MYNLLSNIIMLIPNCKLCNNNISICIFHRIFQSNINPKQSHKITYPGNIKFIRRSSNDS